MKIALNHARRAVYLVAFLLAPAFARAQTPEPTADKLSSFAVNEGDPESALPTPAQAEADPLNYGYLLLDLTSKAEQAMKQKDFATASRYYRALVKGSPDAAIGHSKLCEIYELQNDRVKGIDACRSALGLRGVRVMDYQRFVRLLLSKPEPLTPAETKEVTDVISHLQKDANTRAATAQIQCDLGLRIADLNLLRECTTVLMALAPKDPKTISYEWAFAMARKDMVSAKHAIEKARAAGVNLAGVQKMEEATLQASGTQSTTVMLPIGLCILLLGACGTVLVRGRATPKASGGRRVS